MTRAQNVPRGKLIKVNNVCSKFFVEIWWYYYFNDILFYVFVLLFLFLSSGSSGGYVSTSNAFIFSLRNKEGLGPFKSMVTVSNTIYRDSSYGPTFGGGHDIHIHNNANSNTNSYTYFGTSYSVPSGVQDKKTLLAGTYKFTPDEVEVFYLG